MFFPENGLGLFSKAYDSSTNSSIESSIDSSIEPSSSTIESSINSSIESSSNSTTNKSKLGGGGRVGEAEDQQDEESDDLHAGDAELDGEARWLVWCDVRRWLISGETVLKKKT